MRRHEQQSGSADEAEWKMHRRRIVIIFGALIGASLFSNAVSTSPQDSQAATDAAAEAQAGKTERAQLVSDYISSFKAGEQLPHLDISDPEFGLYGAATVTITIGHCQDELPVTIWTDGKPHFGTESDNPFIIYPPNERFRSADNAIGRLPETPENLVGYYDNRCLEGLG